MDNTAIQSLKPLLPGTFPCQGEERGCYHLNALMDVYAPEVSSATTETYLEQLQVVAQATGKMLEEFLATELAKLNAAACAATNTGTADEAPAMDSTQKSIRQVHASAGCGILHSEPQPTTTLPAMDHAAAVHLFAHTTAAPPANLIQSAPSATATLKLIPTPRVEKSIPHISTGLKSSPRITINDVNPPERVVVEHIVRNADASSPVHMSSRLRSFSGKCSHSNSEVDYETWRANVELILKDPPISDLHRARKILDT